METKFTNEEIVKEVTRFLIEKNDVWKKLYEGYAKDILGIQDVQSNQCKHLIQYEERGVKLKNTLGKTFFNLYSKITDAKRGNTFDIRASGESIGDITIKNNGTARVDIKKTKHERIKRLFGIEAKDSYNEVLDFIHLLKQKKLNEAALHSKEHEIESLMLNMFDEKTGKNKPIKIRPVTMGNAYIQFTTPVSASNHKKLPHFQASIDGGAKGGGIDILARICHNNEVFDRLAVIEIKDENTSSEPQKVVLQQAIAYATFIAFLLRQDFGNLWWTIFTRHKDSDSLIKTPHQLDFYNKRKYPIDVISLMPKSDFEKSEDKGCLKDLVVNVPDKEPVILHPCTLYYIKKEDGSIDFEGSLLDE